mgnify:FL=1
MHKEKETGSKWINDLIRDFLNNSTENRLWDDSDERAWQILL